ncbi:alpha/beta hydrolase [Streptomyces radicis]|uniref:Alpha/beta hydrolase n=1 Tax=Streptomyces radicis TaxID=1750517 RepID=A0A3A9W032_9ACTN|nr:alpha/beta hydrolase [Streptomyces radicis]RKN06320.1 alpha/beta hydrolase [Streptomyces radicis]RKN18650.1 alpha/beta hydrolase [Streptomyces radicis]
MNAVEHVVPVRGGDLAVTHWPARGAAGPPVIALHGITSNGRFLAPLARALAANGTPVHAPDLRGRGASRQLPGPYGLSAHVADVLALADALGDAAGGTGGDTAVDARGPRPILLGHSMGAFVAALAAATHPGRFARLVLVDGGLGFPAPAGHDIDALLDAVIGPAMRRLSLTFPDRASYHAYFREHPALADHFGDDLRHHLDRDLVGEPPMMRSACVLDAVRADGADVLSDPATLAAVHRLRDPATLLLAERGLLNEPRALYDPERVAAAGLDPATVTVHQVPDTNHYTILLAEHAVAAVAAAVTW